MPNNPSTAKGMAAVLNSKLTHGQMDSLCALLSEGSVTTLTYELAVHNRRRNPQSYAGKPVVKVIEAEVDDPEAAEERASNYGRNP